MSGALPLVVAIDGPAGSGKSSVARLVAERVGIAHLDTGAMYRSVAWACRHRGVDPCDADAVAALARALRIEVDAGRVAVDGTDVTAAIRTPEVDAAVGPVASNAAVRAELVVRQRAWADERGGAVMEGRDIATVVFPDAPVKVFLTASEEERARRRAAQNGGDLQAVAADLARRDHVDTTRTADPLRVAEGSTILDTTGLGLDDVVDRIAAMVEGARSRREPGIGGIGGNVDSPGDQTSSAPATGPAAAGPEPGTATRRAEELAGSGPVGRSLYRTLWWIARLVNGGWFRVRYHHREAVPASGGFLLAPVHRSNVDFLVVGNVTRRRMRYVGKETIWKPRWFRPLADALGGIKVERGTPDRASMRRCLEVLEAGEPLVLFPEGTRRSGPEVAELFEGAVYLALKAGVPIVPVGIGGSAAAMPHGAKFPRRVPIEVVVGHPITVEPGEKATSRRVQREVTVRLRAEIQRVFDEATALAVARSR
jgi:cytidylate kinase